MTYMDDELSTLLSSFFDNITNEASEDLVGEFVDLFERHDGIRSARTFEEAGVLTGNRGVVLELGDGSRIQLQVVSS